MKEAPEDIIDAVRGGDAGTLETRLPQLEGAVDDYGSNGRPLVEWAAIEGKVESLQALLEAGSKPASMPGILHTCIFSGWGQGPDVSMVEALLDAGCDPNQREKGDSGATPLYTAAMTAPFPRRAAAATKLLLARGADPRVRCGADTTPLHVAAAGISADTVQMLLEAGADPSASDTRGRTPAHHCIRTYGESRAHAEGDEDDDSVAVAVQLIADNLTLLIEHGADLGVEDTQGQTPLQGIVGLEGCPESIVALMLDGGAPADVRIEVREDALDLLAVATVQRYSDAMIVRLYEAGCPTDETYAMFGGRCWLEIATLFEPHYGVALCRHSEAFAEHLAGHRTAKGTNMLACAAVAGSRELVELMQRQGLSPTEKNSEGHDAIDAAEANGHAELAAYLSGSS